MTGSEVSRLELDIGGMTCAACAAAVERALNGIGGATASVNPGTDRAVVSGLGVADAARAIAAVEQAGYTAAVHQPGDDAWSERAVRARLSSLRPRLAVSALLAIPLCDLTILLALVPGWRFAGWEFLCIAVAVPIVLWCAWPFHRATWRGLRHRVISMDALVSLGTAVSFLWALFTILIAPSDAAGYWLGFGRTPPGADAIYLDVAAGMVTFQLAGRYVETRARRRAGDVLRALDGLTAKEVRLVDEDGGEHVEPLGRLRIGDAFVVLPGERIVGDGTVADGRSAIDSSAMTGEALPADAAPGTKVTAGTVNLSGRLVIVAEAVGTRTRLAQMAAIAEEAQLRKARIQRIVDRVASVLVPAVIALAIIVVAAWLLAGQPMSRALASGVAVLIIACPCALGLATPTALVVGVARGGQLGILIKGQDALEASGRIDTLVFDKTGTLTTGRMRVSAVDGDDPDEVIRVAAAVEQGSGHPIGEAIAERAAAAGDLPAARGHRSRAGLGASAEIDGRIALVGSPAMLRSFGVATPGNAVSDERTEVFVAIDGQTIGRIRLTDELRDSAPVAVATLRSMGIRVLMITGDADGPARHAGRAAGVDQIRSTVLPGRKAEIIRSLQRSGHRVAMVGDGINDSAALATADLGIAMVSGSDIALKSADVIVVRDDLRTVVDAIRLSRRTLRTIRQNLVWALLYNLAAIPIAALGLLNPLVAAAAMALSSVLVVWNSLRLRRFAGSPNGWMPPSA